MSDPKLYCSVTYIPIGHFLLSYLTLSNLLNLFEPYLSLLYKADMHRNFLIGKQCRLRKNDANKMLSLVPGRKWDPVNVSCRDGGDRDG